MRLAKKLREWRDEGIIDASTAERIAEFEATRKRPLLLQALAGLGATTVGIGLVSVVASNWAGIDYPWKLGGALAIGLALAVATARSARAGRSLATDALALVYYVFTLACLALLGQIYQTGTPAWQALTVWTAATAPLMLLTRSVFSGVSWFVGSSITATLATIAFVETLDSSDVQTNAAVVLLFVWPLLTMALSRGSWMRRERPGLATALSGCSWAAILATGAFLPFVFYGSIGSGDTLGWSVPVVALLAAGMMALLPRWYASLPPTARYGLSSAVGIGVLVLITGTTFARGDAEALGAIVQVLYLAVLTWTGLRMGWTTAFNFLTAVIALRILVIYLEVFGSMLSTGLGMITGGLLTLAMAWAWKSSLRRTA